MVVPRVTPWRVGPMSIDTRFIVKLSDQHPQDEAARAKGEQPAFTPVSKGWLKASHREKDEARSTPTRPFYTHANPQPIEPGQIYELDIEVLPISYVFKKGHRIRLQVTSSRFPSFDRNPNTGEPFGTSSRMVTARQTVFHDAAHPSRVILPVIPRGI